MIVLCMSPFLSHPQPTYLQQFVAVADYQPVDDVEMGLQEGDVVEILRTGSTGWWLAHHMTTNQEGWVPSTYLDPIPNTGSRSLASVSSIGEYCGSLRSYFFVICHSCHSDCLY